MMQHCARLGSCGPSTSAAVRISARRRARSAWSLRSRRSQGTTLRHEVRISVSERPTVRPYTPSTQPRSLPVAGMMGFLNSARSTTLTITPPSSSTQMGIVSKPCATHRRHPRYWASDGFALLMEHNKPMIILCSCSLPQLVLSVAVSLKVLAIALTYRDLFVVSGDALPHISRTDFAFE